METETAKPLGALLPGIVDQTGETGSSAPLTERAASIDLSTLPARLDDRMLAMVRAISSSPALVDAPCPEEHFIKSMRAMSILPRRADDDLTGELRVGLYQRKLGDKPAAAISFLCSEALGRCEWFPSIAECLRILAEFPGTGVGERRRDTARHLVQRELNARLDEMVARLATRALTQDEIDALPESAKLVAAEKCYLWAWPDGRFTVRADITQMTPEAAEAERERVKEMMAEWATIRAAQAEAPAADEAA